MAELIYNGVNSLNVVSNNGNNIYNFRIEIYLNSQNVEEKTSNVTINMYWRGSSSYFSQYAYAFNYTNYEVWLNLNVDGETTQIGRKINQVCYKYDTLATTWTGDIEHNDDGFLAINVGCGVVTTSIGYLPSASSVSNITTNIIEIKPIEVGTKGLIKINGEWKKGKPYIKVNGNWKKIKASYIKINGSWKKTK